MQRRFALVASPDLADEAGDPDPGKIKADAEQLAVIKPHLAARRPASDVGQGPAAYSASRPTTWAR